jgi:predicted DNA-binding transcriptional regulator AlpA
MNPHKLGPLTAHLASTLGPRRAAARLAACIEPALLDARQGADFIGVSLRKFHALRPDLPPPVVLATRVVRWKTAALRQYVENLTAAGPRPEPAQLAAARAQKQPGTPVGGKPAEAGKASVVSKASSGVRRRAVQSNHERLPFVASGRESLE